LRSAGGLLFFLLAVFFRHGASAARAGVPRTGRRVQANPAILSCGVEIGQTFMRPKVIWRTSDIRLLSWRMAEQLISPEADPITDGASTPQRQGRFMALGLVLAVSFLQFIAASCHYLIVGMPTRTSEQMRFALLNGILLEVTALFLLWFVLRQQGRTWTDIGLNVSLWDIPQGIGLTIGALCATILPMFFLQLVYLAMAGHYVQARSMRGLLGAGISILSIVFVVINPAFEELIVRAYTMTEIVGIGGSRTLAVLVSVGIQMSYHLYQGLLNCIALTALFAVFSLYFAKTRRITPIILAHFCFDAYALLRTHP
jgi:membrane protease YdiL (CAAX protease family)